MLLVFGLGGMFWIPVFLGKLVGLRRRSCEVSEIGEGEEWDFDGVV